jgi:hypothetical protein
MLNNLACDDDTFGFIRDALEIRACEDGRHPLSRFTIDGESIQFLNDFFKAAQSPIFRHAALEMVFIWAIDEDCKLHLAIEELAVDGGHLNVQGVPRPRKLEATQNFMKLGHPTLIVGDRKFARIAGELYLTRSKANSRTLVWGINAESGRYCKDPDQLTGANMKTRRPTKTQLENVKAMLESYGLQITEIDVLRMS